MKKIVCMLALVGVLAGLSACKQEANLTKEKKEESVSMKRVEETEQSLDEPVGKNNEKDEKTTNEKAKTKQVEIKKLLNDFGDGYANYDSINNRNDKLKKVMTEECIKMNGINFDSAVMLTSKGEVKSIFQPIDGEKDQYAVLLNCIQNGSEIRVLLVVKVTGDKISEMTYNTVRQEY